METRKYTKEELTDLMFEQEEGQESLNIVMVDPKKEPEKWNAIMEKAKLLD